MVACAQKKQAQKTTARTPERAESSFIFSLSELSRMEAERVRAEEDAARAERDALVRAGHEADERVRREARRLHEEEAKRASEIELQGRAEAARIEAGKLATVEVAKVTAEVNARAQAAEQQRAHELELEKLRIVARYGGKKRGLLGALAGAVFVTGAALAMQLGVLQPQAEQHLRETAAQTTARDAEIATVKAEVSELTTTLGTVKAELRASREANKKLADELAEARRAPTGAPLVKNGQSAAGLTSANVHANAQPLPDTGDRVPPGFHRCPGGKTNGDPTCW